MGDGRARMGSKYAVTRLSAFLTLPRGNVTVTMGGQVIPHVR